MKLFADRLKDLRERAGVSQVALAAMINSNQRRISYIETDRSEPEADLIIGIARALNTTADYLLGLTDDLSPRDADQTQNENPLAKFGISPELWRAVALASKLPAGEQQTIAQVLMILANEWQLRNGNFGTP